MSQTSSSSNSSTSEDSVVSRGLKRKRETEDFDEVSDESDGSTVSSESSEPDSEPEVSKEIKAETNVLSHAAQRKLRKKAQRSTQEPNYISRNQDVTKDKTEANMIPRRQNSIWVGNLAFKTTEQALRDFFARHVPACEITRVNMPKKSGQDVKDGSGMRGQNKGFAYVDFTTEEAKVKAIEASEQNLDGRKLLIKDGRSFEGRPSGPPIEGDYAKTKSAKKILGTQKELPAPTLFVGNLGFQVTETSLKDMLDRHRKFHKDGEVAQTNNEKSWIRKIRLGTFEDSGKCKGWAFVDFHNVEDATRVLVNPKNYFLDGRKLVLQYASQEAVRRGGGGLRIYNKPSSKKASKSIEQGKTSSSDCVEEKNANEEPVSKRMRLETNTRPKRAKPGAALAMAKRETAAIVPSIGTKIVF